MKLAIVSGGFDPVHVGHVELLQKAREKADSLFVIVNNDAFLERKKGKAFMPLKERIAIMQSFKGVELALESVDEDDTVCETLTWLSAAYKPKFEEIFFCNGGDRTSGENTPEHEICLKVGIEPVYGLGDKIQSSSDLLQKT
jgi:cytidyltransferase-like protein|tara:strand:- start:174 stop:599 length:426 start_codon:yes stop_codon:yes gene_type:complete